LIYQSSIEGEETSMKKRIMSLLALALVAGALVIPASPAQASFVGAAHCQVQLGSWPNGAGGSADCNSTLGLVVGVKTDPPQACVPAAAPCTFNAHVNSYSEPCPVPNLPLVPPLVGFANGTLNVNGQQVGTFNWVRVGLTAVIVPTGGGSSAGVAAFVPQPPFGNCQASLPLTAQVVGVAAAP
jgi:hypothetical protein